jgi:regulator of replication initiation timing
MHRIYFLFKLLFLLCSFNIYAQNEKLTELITERKSLYQKYEQALDQKSGIFGKQNKADLQDLNQILKGIIKKDNEILEEIENISANDFEKLQTSFNDIIVENEKIKLKNKSLEKRLSEEKGYQKMNHSEIERANGDKYLLIIASILSLIVFGGVFIKQRTKNRILRQIISKMEQNQLK